MSRNQLTPDELVACLAEPPSPILKYRIPTIPAPEPIHVTPASGVSSSGPFAKLPPELVHAIFNQLDMLTLSKLVQTSTGVRKLVLGLPAYHNMITYAPRTLAALGKTLAITFHTAAQLNKALYEEACVSCGMYGPFLFLGTCERCCYYCHSVNPMLWVIPRTIAEYVYNLPKTDVRKLRHMHSVPGHYSATHQTSLRQRRWLVVAREAYQAGIARHGSIETVRLVTMQLNGYIVDLNVQRALLYSPMLPFGATPWFANINFMPNRNYFGMAIDLFPSLAYPRGFCPGYWCRGCLWMHQHKVEDMAAIITSVPWNDFFTGQPVWTADGIEYVLDMASKLARSKPDFLAHVATCFGARELIKRRGRDLF